MLPRNYMRSDPRLRIASASTLGVENSGMTIEGLRQQVPTCSESQSALGPSESFTMAAVPCAGGVVIIIISALDIVIKM